MEPVTGAQKDLFLQALAKPNKGSAQIEKYSNRVSAGFARLFGTSVTKMDYKGTTYYVKSEDFNKWCSSNHIGSKGGKDFERQVGDIAKSAGERVVANRMANISPSVKVAAYHAYDLNSDKDLEEIAKIIKPDLKEIEKTLRKYKVKLEEYLQNKIATGTDLVAADIKKLQETCKQFISDVKEGKVQVDPDFKEELSHIAPQPATKHDIENIKWESGDLTTRLAMTPKRIRDAALSSKENAQAFLERLTWGAKEGQVSLKAGERKGMLFDTGIEKNIRNTDSGKFLNSVRKKAGW